MKLEFPAVPPVSVASLPSTGCLWEGSCSVFSTPSQQVTADSDKISPEPISALAEPASAPQPLLAGWVLQPHHLSGFPQTPSGLSTSVLCRVARKGRQQPDPASQVEGNNHIRPPAACAFPGQDFEPHGVAVSPVLPVQVPLDGVLPSSVQTGAHGTSLCLEGRRKKLCEGWRIGKSRSVVAYPVPKELS